jgi:hydroxymethylbilane synthase
MSIKALRFGTRGSDLALWQTRHVMELLQAALPGLEVTYEIIHTRGDHLLDTPLPLVGGKGVFTAELESALHEKRIDCAVHSLKDLPTSQPDGLVIGAITPRANPADALISRRGYTLSTLPHGARVGTSSYRRIGQLLRIRPDLTMIDIRGNVDTRIRKALAADGNYDAIVLACAGLERLGRLDEVSQILTLEAMLPAPGQGTIAVQTRHDPALLRTLKPIHDSDTALAVAAERAFLAGLGGGCSLPVAAHARYEDQWLKLRGRVTAPDGARHIDLDSTTTAGDLDAACAAGMALAEQALTKGAKSLMEQGS